MRRSRLAARTFGILLAISAAAMAAIMLSSALAMKRVYIDATLFSLGQSAAAIANGIEATTPGGAVELCGKMAAGTSLRISIIDADGSVLGDSESEPASMDNHLRRPEVAGAMDGAVSTSMRPSATLGLVMAYAAAPIRAGNSVVGVARVAMAAPELTGRLAPFVAASVAIAIIMLAAMALASARFGRSVTDPVLALIDAAGDWSAGRLGRRVKRFADPEMAPLADTMNAMASELAARVVAMENQKRELGAILDGMSEAVLSVDADLVVRTANPKARELFGDAGAIEGKTILQASGNLALDAIAKACAESARPSGSGDYADGAAPNAQPAETEITLYGTTTTHLLVHAAPLPQEGGRGGVVLVLNDITRLKRLERVRKDFVANVSHELRTPITLIKGFAETLEDIADPVDSKRFLAIIKRHADRMASIVDDLLTLARLEGPDRGKLMTAPVDASKVIARAIESLGDRPADRNVTIVADAAPGLRVSADEGLLEQALVNLIDNAVKYGYSGGTVRVSACIDGERARFRVSDDGPGIPAQDRQRLFERFYRVDKARSRDLGGTGLGLSIVRHIALAHGGDAVFDSREGVGSAFSILIPLRHDAEDEVIGTGLDSVHDASPNGDMPSANS